MSDLGTFAATVVANFVALQRQPQRRKKRIQVSRSMKVDHSITHSRYMRCLMNKLRERLVYNTYSKHVGQL